MKSQRGHKGCMKQHYLGPEVCPHQCSAVAEVLPSPADHVQYRCPKCGEFRVSSSVDECLKGRGYFRRDDNGLRWLVEEWFQGQPDQFHNGRMSLIAC